MTHDLLPILGTFGFFAVLVAPFWLLMRRARRRGVGGVVGLSLLEELYHPAAQRSRVEVQVQSVRAAPAPAPGDPPKA